MEFPLSYERDAADRKGGSKAEEEARDQNSHSSAAPAGRWRREEKVGERESADWQKAIPSAGGMKEGTEEKEGLEVGKKRRMKELENREEKSHLVF